MKAKILIVGGGVMGTSLAIKTALKTESLTDPIVLLERSEIGAGSSGGSGAILRQFYADRMVALMARDSLREYASFETRTGRPIGFQRPGILTIAGPGQADFEACRELIRKQTTALREVGIPIEYVEAEAIARLLPNVQLGADVVGAWEPEGAFVDPLRTLHAFAALARTYGAITRLGVELEDVIVENGRVVGAHTADGEVTTEKIVLVAGPWTGKILEKLGVDIPLRIVSPENFYFSMPDVGEESPPDHGVSASGFAFDIAESFENAGAEAGTVEPIGMHPVLIDLERDFYARCEPTERRTRVGRVDYENHPVLRHPEDIEASGREEFRAWARQALVGRLPEYEGRADAGDLVSWYTLTPDAQAVVGPVPDIEGLFIAAGFSGHGFKLGPSIANGLTQMLFDEPVTAFDPEFFSPTRFQGRAADQWTGRFGL